MSNYISTSEVFLLSLIEEYLHKHDDDDDLKCGHKKGDPDHIENGWGTGGGDAGGGTNMGGYGIDAFGSDG